jgi:Ca2+-binding RTX toxin-like protein
MKKYSALVFAVLTIALGPLASAGTLGISIGRLIVGTEPGDGNQTIVASMVGNDLRITGADFDLVTPGCTSLGSATFDCPISGFNELVILGGDGDDAITLAAITQPTFDVTILGGPGDDILIGSGGDDSIFGGPGDDVLIGGPGNDCLSGGSGNNVVIQSLRAGCSGGPDPVITPLPRAAAVPEPSGVFLLATAIAAVPLARRNFRGQLRWRGRE